MIGMHSRDATRLGRYRRDNERDGLRQQPSGHAVRRTHTSQSSAAARREARTALDLALLCWRLRLNGGLAGADTRTSQR
jgi:hypothetical protein